MNNRVPKRSQALRGGLSNVRFLLSLGLPSMTVAIMLWLQGSRLEQERDIIIENQRQTSQTLSVLALRNFTTDASKEASKEPAEMKEVIKDQIELLKYTVAKMDKVRDDKVADEAAFQAMRKTLLEVVQYLESPAVVNNPRVEAIHFAGSMVRPFIQAATSFSSRSAPAATDADLTVLQKHLAELRKNSLLFQDTVEKGPLPELFLICQLCCRQTRSALQVLIIDWPSMSKDDREKYSIEFGMRFDLVLESAKIYLKRCAEAECKNEKTAIKYVGNIKRRSEILAALRNDNIAAAVEILERTYAEELK
jgi:hypothetical protein